MTNKQTAIKIIRILHKNGFQALLAGGCVRDMLLGKRAKDYDVATDARPEQIIKLFKRTLEVGAKFGVVIVLFEKQQFEVATFRTESGYYDGRHPSKVEFANPVEDAARRDFTVNGMFYDTAQEKVIDYVKGRADLKKRVIRTIGDPAARFGEDYLRMLRAIRFATQLEFKIEPKTWAAVCKWSNKIKHISGERICTELEGILANPNRSTGAECLVQSGLAEAIFGLDRKEAKVGIKVLESLPEKVDFPLALAGFLAGCKTGHSLEKLRVLKLSRRAIKHIKFLLENRDRLLDDKMSLAKLKLFLSEPYFYDLFEFQKAIQKVQARDTIVLSGLKKRIKALGDVELKPKPLLNGHELIKLGAVPGPSLGQLAQEMYIAQLEGDIKTKPHTKKWVQKWLENHRNTGK